MSKHIWTMAALAAALLLAGCTAKKEKVELPILAWYSIPEENISLERFQELKEAGFNVNLSSVGSFDKALASLDSGEQTGVKIVFS